MSNLKQVVEMERILNYIMEHLEEELPISQVADSFHYNEAYFAKKFSEYFGIPYGKFLQMLQLRKAAHELRENKRTLKEIAGAYGYSEVRSFSKAFKRELGMTPREFLRTDISVPDMPLRKTIHGHKLQLQYIRMQGFQMAGYPIPVKHGKKTDLLRECAYPFAEPDERINLDCQRSQIGVWWHNSEGELFYLMGFSTDSKQEIAEGMESLDIPGGDYAVFSVERGKTAEDILETQRRMVRYAMNEWEKMNWKEPDRMAVTYEAFDKNYSYLFLPLVRGMLKQSTMEEKDTHGIDKWIDYIDRHITENLTIQELAMAVHYSETHFREIFKSYYGTYPADYIRRRRLYLTAGEIRKAKNKREIQKAALKYHFHSEDTFRELFRKEFDVDPEDYGKVDIQIVDLEQYYSRHKEQIKVTFCEENETKMIGVALRSYETEKERKDDMDIPGLAGYWMKHTTDPIKDTIYACTEPGQENNMALWCNASSGKGYDFILGPVVAEFENLPDNVRSFTVEGGKYAVFETLEESDEANLADAYRMLTRLVFYGWIKENRVRVNLNKLTYVRYYERKLHFYVPLYS